MKTTAVALLVIMALAPAVAGAEVWMLTATLTGKQPFVMALGPLHRDQCLQVIQWLAANGGAFTEYTATAIQVFLPAGSMTCDETVTQTRGLRPTQYPQTKSSGEHGWWLAGPVGVSTHEDGIARYLAVGPFESQAQCATVIRWMGQQDHGKRAGLASTGLIGGSTLSIGGVTFKSLSCSSR